MQFQCTTFHNAFIILDGNEYDGCQFENCYLVYRGSTPPAITNCSFPRSTLAFEGEAAHTLTLLHTLHHSEYPPTIEQTFDNIRSHTGPMDWTIH